jgi:hypothetical protein
MINPASVWWWLHLSALIGGTWLILAAPGRVTLRLPPLKCALLLATAMGLFLFLISDPLSPLEDFRQAYWRAGAALRGGPQGLIPEIERGVEGFVNLPIVAYLFWPFGLLPDKVAALLYLALGLVSLLWCWRLMVELAGLDQRKAGVLLFLMAGSGPLLYGLREGNSSHLVLLLMVLALAAVRGRREFTAGVLLGVVAVVKPPLLLLGLLFLARGRWRVVFGGTVAIGTLVALSLSVFGLELHQRWYELCIAPYSGKPLAAFNAQSLQAFVLRFQTGGAGLFDWAPISLAAPYDLYSRLLVFATAVAAFACLVWPVVGRGGFHRTPRLVEIEFLLVVALVCVISPVSWSHYHSWFLPAFALFLSGRESGSPRWAWRSLGWVGIVLLSSPVIGPRDEPVWLSWMPYMQLAVSGLLLGSLLWIGLLAAERGQLSMLLKRAKDLPSPARDQAAIAGCGAAPEAAVPRNTSRIAEN